MGVLTLLERARAAGLAVERRDDSLVIRGPRSAVPLVRTLGACKSEILAILGDRGRGPGPAASGQAIDDRPHARQDGQGDERERIDRSPPESSPWRIELAGWTDARREAWEERAGIMEFDGGLSRNEAEHRAFVEGANASDLILGVDRAGHDRSRPRLASEDVGSPSGLRDLSG